MSHRLIWDGANEQEEMRQAYSNTLVELAGKDSRIVALDADLMNCIAMGEFKKRYPERTFDLGIQEANMIGVAAGLSATGKIPFAHTFGPFATRRCFDQLFLSVGYSKLNVRVIGSDPGITAAMNGGTHMPFEDMGIVRNIPGATILEPADSVMLKDLLRQTAQLHGLFYIRLVRKSVAKIYEEGSTFEIGKGVVLREGGDITLIASGIMVNEAMMAALLLKDLGIEARVVNLFTIKPIDRELIIDCAGKTGAIVTAENHSIINGLGSAVAEVLSEHAPVPLERVGVQDQFGEVGTQDYLRGRFELTCDAIVQKAVKAVKRKGAWGKC